jgi:nicotinate-nucleotide adenylyltransferase
VNLGLFGGTFDPPHNGHVALARSALAHFGLERLLVLVVVDPGHRAVEADFDSRFDLARRAFGDLPRTEVLAEEHPYTIDALRGARYEDTIFLVGADEFAGFLSWKEPDEVLEHVRLGVATRPGHDRARLDAVLAKLRRPQRVEFFEIPAFLVSSTELRERLHRGEPVEDVVPEAVAREIEVAGLYRWYPES